MKLARLALTLALVPLLGAAGDPYLDALAESRAREASGDLGAAARTLEGALAHYPQDYALRLQLGWLEFQQGHDDLAARRYSEALAVGGEGGGLEARLGLGWALARLDRCEEARAAFDAVLAVAPGHASARQGLTRCAAPPAVTVTPLASGSLLFYGDNPIRKDGRAITAGAVASVRDRWLLGARYRYTELSGARTWNQQEAYLDAGYATASLGLVAHYALVDDETGYTSSHHAGLTGRWQSATLDAAVSSYSDLTVLRLEPSWRWMIGGGLSVIPALAFQQASDESLFGGRLVLSLERAAFGVWLGGKLGDELRPAYLASAIVNNARERIEGGFAAGGHVRLGPVDLSLSYSLDRLKRITSTTTDDATAITFGVTTTY